MHYQKRFILNKKLNTSTIIKEETKRMLSECCNWERRKRIKDASTKWSKLADRMAEK